MTDSLNQRAQGVCVRLLVAAANVDAACLALRGLSEEVLLD